MPAVPYTYLTPPLSNPLQVGGFSAGATFEPPATRGLGSGTGAEGAGGADEEVDGGEGGLEEVGGGDGGLDVEVGVRLVGGADDDEEDVVVDLAGALAFWVTLNCASRDAWTEEARGA